MHMKFGTQASQGDSINSLEHLQVRVLNVTSPELHYSKTLKKEDLTPWSREDQTVAKHFSLISRSPVTNLVIYSQSNELTPESGMLGLMNYPRSGRKDLKTYSLIMVFLIFKTACKLLLTV